VERGSGHERLVPPGVTVAVTDHAVERFRQRVAARRGDLDARPEIAPRVSEAWAAGRVNERPPDADGSSARPVPRGSLYVADLVDRDVVFVCRHDAAARELVVITLWERERLGRSRVPRRFTDALERRRNRLDSDG
jgi:hypothetical protein